jgi:hypothetical protein
MLSVVMLNVVMLNVVMLNVVAPNFGCLTLKVNVRLDGLYYKSFTIARYASVCSVPYYDGKLRS